MNIKNIINIKNIKHIINIIDIINFDVYGAISLLNKTMAWFKLPRTSSGTASPCCTSPVSGGVASKDCTVAWKKTQVEPAKKRIWRPEFRCFMKFSWFLLDDFQCWNMQILVQHELSWRIWNPVFFLASDVLHHTLIVILGQPIVVKPQEHSEASSSSTWASASYRMTVPLAARGTKAHYPHACPGIMRSQITTEDPQLDNSWKNQRSPCSASSWIMNHPQIIMSTSFLVRSLESLIKRYHYPSV